MAKTSTAIPCYRLIPMSTKTYGLYSKLEGFTTRVMCLSRHYTVAGDWKFL